MKSAMFKKEIKLVRNQILQNYKFIKEIDFNKDINIDKSGRFTIDTEEEYLEFLFQEKEKITSNDYIVIFGDIKVDDGRVKMVPTLNGIFGSSVSVLIKKTIIRKEVDVIYVEFHKSKNSYFYFRPSNSAFYNIMHRIKEKDSKNISLNDLDVDKCKTVDCIFHNNSLTINKRIGKELDRNNAVSLSLRNDSIEFLINMKRGYARIENKKINIPFFDIGNKEEMCIGLYSLTQDDLRLNQTAYIKSIIYGSEYGYIYLNSFKVKSKNMKIITICQGNPIMQYYSEGKGEWINVEKNDELYIRDDIQLRIKMMAGDKIYKFFIVEKRL